MLLRDSVGNWQVPQSPQEDLCQADVILTHEFGNQRDVSETTRQIVELGLHLHRLLGVPLLCQYPGNLVAERAGVSPALVIEKNLAEPGAYLDTHEVNRQVKEYCYATHCGCSVIICTHPEHLWRAGQDLRAQGILPLYPDTTSVHYDSHNKRWWLQGGRRFRFREVHARLRDGAMLGYF